MVFTARRFGVATACAAGLAVVVLTGAPRAQSTTQKPPNTPQVPVFRANTNFVQVDAYPTKDGRIVEGLTAKDFQVFEDGKPQSIESFEFIRIEPSTAEMSRRDPNTQEEGNRLAADPRNRVFVLYLDHFHASLSGSHAIIQPIVTMLNRVLTPNDLFGVATALMQPRDLVLGRQTTTIEDQLTRNWTWGRQAGVISFSPEEDELVRCYGEARALEIVDRTREDRTLDSLSQLVRHLGALREARKALIVFGIGWKLYEPDQGRLLQLADPNHFASHPRVGVTTGGKLSMDQPANPGMANWTACATEMDRAYNLDNRKKFRALIDEANRNNVSFYPVNVDGLASGAQAESMRTLAENTDGLISNTNDFNAGLRRIADDVSAYYLLGYSSTNPKSDGGYRRIGVKVAAPGTRIKARRGYVAMAPDSPKSGPVGPAKPAAPAGVTDALGALSRLRLTAEVFTYGAASATDIGVVVELPSSAAISAPWDKGADVQLTIAAAGGTASAPVTARIEAGQRSVLTRLPRPAGNGPFRVNIKLASGGVVVTDRIDVIDAPAGVLGEALLFRATPAAQSPLRAAADYQFWRTERVHIEWPVAGALDRREGRLLGKDGRALPVPVNLTEREQNGRPILAADLNLAPLAAGDYVIEVTAAKGTDEATRYIPIRVVR